MPPRILVNKHTPLAVPVFSSIGEVTALDTAEITRDTVRDADILVVRSESKVAKQLLEGSRVRFVGTVTVGTDHIDTDYLSEHGIVCKSAAGCNAQSVAEYILAALLVLAKKKKISLRDKVLGVVGVGNIGSKVVAIATALGMTVLQYDPPLARTTGGNRFVSFDELLSADIVTLHVPFTKIGTDPTFHMFNEQTFARMKRGAVLINTSRGGVVETQALKKALDDRQLSEAILDVWENEPDIDTELLSRAFLGTQHIAGHSLDGKLNAVQMIYEEACSFLSVSPSVNVREYVPKSDLRTIHVNGTAKDDVGMLDSIVRQAYDIEYDDMMLRRILDLPARERPKYFSTLRATYRERNEFGHYRVDLPDSAHEIKKILQTVKFHIERMG
jgi:erythronate-4-phosphate dehydrogenase